MDKVRILNLKIPAKHGVYDFEKKSVGIFEIDIQMQIDLSKAMISDDLKDTVDYNDVVELTKKIFSENDYNLIEYVAGKVCENLLEKYPIKNVIVKVRKPHAPINACLDTVEVEVERTK